MAGGLLYLFRGNDTRAVGADQPRLALLLQRVLHADHVLLRDPLRDAHDQGHLGLHGLHDGGGRARRRHVYHRGVRLNGGHGLQVSVSKGSTPGLIGVWVCVIVL